MFWQDEEEVLVQADEEQVDDEEGTVMTEIPAISKSAWIMWLWKAHSNASPLTI